MKSILEYCPKQFELREHQIEILRQVEAAWDKHFVITIPAGVGTGKSLIGQTIARWANTKKLSVGTITPRNKLQDQYTDSFPDVPSLKGRGKYQCEQLKMSCSEGKELLGGLSHAYCSECPIQIAKEETIGSNNAIFNFQSYLLNKCTKNVVIIDEAHNALGVLEDSYTTILWQHKFNYPDNMNTCGEVAIWLEEVIKKETAKFKLLEEAILPHKETDLASVSSAIKRDVMKLRKSHTNLSRQINKYKQVRRGLDKAPDNFFIERVEELYAGRKQPALKIRPTTLDGLPPVLWGKHTRKLILMSGTINEIDIQDMGLGRRTCAIIKAQDPIDLKRKPFVVENLINMGYKYQDKNLPKMVAKIRDIMSRHADTKGVIHTTYGLAKKFQTQLNDTRVLYHTSENREEVLETFLTSEEPVVLVACGMSEGLDLAGEAFGFQMITKVMWPNKKDKLIDYRYKNNMPRILWDTVRTIRQQKGRIVRGPSDYGVTYMLDSAFGNVRLRRRGLFQQTISLWGDSFVNSIEWR